MRRSLSVSLTTLGILFLLTAAAVAQDFGPAQPYLLSSDGDDVCVADLNSDGRGDMVVPCADIDSVAVFLNNGNSSYASPTYFAVADAPTSVFPGDMDGDNDIDLVVANYGAGSVSVLLNNGSGSFGSPTNYSMGSGTSDVYLSDIDGDSDLDVLIVNYSGYLVIRKNNGAGTLASSYSYSAGLYAHPNDLFVGDLNGDTYPDVAVLKATDTSAVYGVGVYINNGSGSFSRNYGVVYATGNTPASIDGGDFDGDNDIDLAVANSKLAAAMSILTNGGSGTFTSSHYTTIGGGVGVVAVDMDGDSDTDLASINGLNPYTQTSLNDGSGSFANAVNHDNFSHFNYLAVYDINGDGDMDIVSTGPDTVSVQRNLEVCCHGMRGNANWDPQDQVNITDITYLVNYMFQGGPAPICMEEADANGDGSVNITDVTYLINYAFQGGPAPAACP